MSANMHYIELLGIGSNKHLELKGSLLTALEELGIPFSLKEVSRIEEIIQYDISAIPAILVNGSIISENELPEKEELMLRIKQFLKEGQADVVV
ncbi:MAG TPA: thioredoxin family protein [Saprospiraceae bacterium]|nr:thioredoxin family protein [Saprospiraceae bacterium]HMQ83640.1 thioredoxin family protein [Saprospiraceae bacterium]